MSDDATKLIIPNAVTGMVVIGHAKGVRMVNHELEKALICNRSLFPRKGVPTVLGKLGN